MSSTMKKENLGSRNMPSYQQAAKTLQNNWREAGLKHKNCLPKDNVNDYDDLYCTAGERIILC